MSQKDFQSNLSDLLGEIFRSGRGHSSAIAGNLQESISANIPAIVLPDSVIQLMDMGVIDSKVAFTQEDLLSVAENLGRILLAIKSASEVSGDVESISEHIAHYQESLSLLTNADLLSYDLKDPFVACDTDAERYALAMVLDDLATDRKIKNKPYIWRTILNNRGKL